MAHALGAWTSIEDLIACVAEVFGAECEELLRRWNRNHTGRQALLYLACRHCRGRYTLTELGELLGGVTLGAPGRARDTLSGRLVRERALRRRVARVEALLSERAADQGVTPMFRMPSGCRVDLARTFGGGRISEIARGGRGRGITWERPAGKAIRPNRETNYVASVSGRVVRGRLVCLCRRRAGEGR